MSADGRIRLTVESSLAVLASTIVVVSLTIGALHQQTRELEMLPDVLGLLETRIDWFHADRGRYPDSLDELLELNRITGKPYWVWVERHPLGWGCWGSYRFSSTIPLDAWGIRYDYVKPAHFQRRPRIHVRYSD